MAQQSADSSHRKQAKITADSVAEEVLRIKNALETEISPVFLASQLIQLASAVALLAGDES